MNSYVQMQATNTYVKKALTGCTLQTHYDEKHASLNYRN